MANLVKDEELERIKSGLYKLRDKIPDDDVMIEEAGEGIRKIRFPEEKGQQ